MLSNKLWEHTHIPDIGIYKNSSHIHEHYKRKVDKAILQKKSRENYIVLSPQDPIIGSSKCLSMDLMLPEHFPKKHPNLVKENSLLTEPWKI